MMKRALIVLALVWAAASGALAGIGPLATPAELAEAQGRALIIDIRPPRSFARQRIEGSVNAPYNLWRGPRDNPGDPPDAARLTTLLRNLGAEADRPTVIAFHGKNASDFGAAARVYWTLKSAGLTDIAILNGGLVAWAAAGGALTSGPAPRITPSEIEVAWSDEWAIDRAGVADVVEGRREARLVDARPLGFFNGETAHPAAAAAGTLKGALRVLHSSWFGRRGAVMADTPEAALEIARNAGYGGPLAPGEELVSFCNTGHWASTNWFALSEVAGIGGVKLYPESMVGWTRAGGAAVKGEN